MAANQGYSFKEEGERNTLVWLGYFEKDNKRISPFHDIPLWADKAKGIANFICEIPRGTQPKLEINKEGEFNPIKQDVKNNKPRLVAIPYPFNYGAFPQTWENPDFVDPRTKAKGDKDPLDVCELGSTTHKTGDVVQVKILGTYAMIDEGETDWKILTIDVNDPDAGKLNDSNDLETYFAENTKKCFEFLRDYKIPDGKGPNNFAFDSKLQNRDFALKIIEETHEEWSKLQSGATKNEGISKTNRTLNNSFTKSD